MHRKPSFQETAKRIAKKCLFCDVSDYSLLDCHRITPGAEGGKYTPRNSIVVCSLHHRMIHSGKIKILGKHPSTSGKYVVFYEENGIEKNVS